MRLCSPNATATAVAFVTSLAALASPRTASAAACCGAGHSVALRLSESENAAVVSGARGALRLGSWASSRDFSAPEGGDYDRELRGEIGVLMRVSRRFDVGAAVPLVYTFRRAGELSSSGGGIGDITASARFRVLSPSEYAWMPGVALTFAALLPTGRPAQASVDRLAADATGLGAVELRPGIVLEKTLADRWLATAGLSVGFRTASAAAGGPSVKLAPRLQAIAAIGPFWSSGLSLSAGVVYEREGGPSIDERVDPGATRERTGALFFAAYDVDSRWTVVASSQVDLPVSGLGRNEIALFALSMGLRRAWSFND